VSIDYNYLNLPEKITFTNNRIIEFTYDATGKKWRKRVTEPGQNAKERDYIEGVEYTIEYKTAGPDIKQDIIHFTEGYIQRDPSTDVDWNWRGWVYKYTIKDHLGNTRVTFDDIDNDGNITVNDVKQVNNYYPFGLNMEGNWSGADGQFKYQYNGKEWNDKEFSDATTGLGWNDYINRWYDPSMARFNTIDAQAEKYPYYSQYQFAGNMPVRFVDLDGLEPKDGQRAWTVVSESYKNTGWGMYTSSDNYYVAQQGQNYRYAKIGDTEWSADVNWKPTNYVNPENFVSDFKADLKDRLPMLQFAAGFAQTSAQISTFGIAGFGLGAGGSMLGRGFTDAGIQLTAQTALNNGSIQKGAANINILESLGAAAGLPIGIQAPFQANFSLSVEKGFQSTLYGKFEEGIFKPTITESQSNQQAAVGFIFGQGGDILFQAKNYKAAVFSTTLNASVKYGGTIGLGVGSALHSTATHGTAIVGEYIENKD
jgi:RHS repeat-associated protein